MKTKENSEKNKNRPHPKWLTKIFKARQDAKQPMGLMHELGEETE
jgi:hypothetical protein